MGTKGRSSKAGADGGGPVDWERIVTTSGAQGKQGGKAPGEGADLEASDAAERYEGITPPEGPAAQGTDEIEAEMEVGEPPNEADRSNEAGEPPQRNAYW